MVALWEWLKVNWMWLVLIHFAYQGVATLGEINHWLKYVLKELQEAPRTAAPLQPPPPTRGLAAGSASGTEAGSDS